MRTKLAEPNNIETPVKCNGGYLDKSGETAKEYFDNRLSICVDWFQVFGTCTIIPIPIQLGETERFEIGERLILFYEGHGSELFTCIFSIFVDGEMVGTLQAHPRHTIDKGSAMIKLENNILYYDDWVTNFLEITTLLQFSVKSVTRLDIAIDGHSGLLAFMNNYLKQSDTQIKMRGKATVKTNYHAPTNEFTWFQVGSSVSEKCISIYNKTKELEQSNKIYIKRFWEANELDTETTIYRCELRLRSKALKSLSSFDIQNLDSKEFLASICQTHFKNFFEFYYPEDDTNTTRCENIPLINWEKLGGTLIDKIKKGLVTDRYKAKLTIHLLIKLHYQHLISETLKVESMPYIDKLLLEFDLSNWYDDKLPFWKKAYLMPTNKKIILNHLTIQLQLSGIHPLMASHYIIDENSLSIDYHICKKAGFQGDWYKFKSLMCQVCNELETRN